MSIRIDFSPKQFAKEQTSSKNFTYIDIGTDNFKLEKNRITNKEIIIDKNTTNYDKDVIKNSLHNILSFIKGESILLQEFGIGELNELIYSPYDKYLAEKITSTIKTILNTWEPRIAILSTPIEKKDSIIIVQINYTIPALNESDTYTYSFKR